jgi:integral membrane protein
MAVSGSAVPAGVSLVSSLPRSGKSSIASLPVPGRVFRALAIAEACSWAGLLIGMFFKYVVVHDEIGVQVFGPIHGALFVAYVVAAVAVARPLGWHLRTLLLALAASIPPLCTLWFERWALRTGRLHGYASSRAR